VKFIRLTPQGFYGSLMTGGVHSAKLQAY